MFMTRQALFNPPASISSYLTDHEAALLASSKARLPAFGRLCSRFASFIGKPELHFASTAQKHWLTAARAALPAMALHGAETEDYQFLACDERPLLNHLDLLLGDPDEVIARPPPHSPAANLTIHLQSYRQGKLIAKQQTNIGASRETPQAATLLQHLEHHFGDPIHARIFAIGHEFGHAWQSQRDKPFVRIAAERSSSAFAKEFLLKFDAYHAAAITPPIPPEMAPLQLANDLFEEACCDAIGCWALERFAHSSPLSHAIDFRRASRSDSSAEYATHWLLESLRQHGGLPERFGDLTRAIAEHCCTHADLLFNSISEFSTASKPTLSESRAPVKSPKP
jgi:hypothetical protein